MVGQITKLSREHLDHLYEKHMKQGFLEARYHEVQAAVKQAGANSYDMLLPETHILSVILKPDEQLGGIVFGRYRESNANLVGRGALAATDERIILIDRKPLYLRCEEIEYDVVSGVSYASVGFMGTITLYTRLGEIRLRTFNEKCALGFMRAVEGQIFGKQVSARTHEKLPNQSADTQNHL